MSTDFAFHILTWLSGEADDDIERETLASLRIIAPGPVTLTEVQDILSANTVRDHINVPVGVLAEWLIVNWWRLRWEPRHGDQPSSDWFRVHSLASIGEGYAWPALTCSSDGDAIRIRLDADRSTRTSTVRFLRSVEVDLRPSEFEQAVDQFVSEVEGRVAARMPGNRDLAELREELAAERSDPEFAADCRRQALAGFDPGSAPEGWLVSARALEESAGSAAADEILAVAPTLHGGLPEAVDIIDAMRTSPLRVTLTSMPGSTRTVPAPPASAPPWVRATALANHLRDRLGVHAGPLSQRVLESLLDVHLPLSPVPGGSRHLMGGFRNGDDHRTAILAREQREDSERFYLARLIGAAVDAPPHEHVLTVSRTFTAHQKFQRAFAQEFLCPWDDLDAFTNEHGTDEDAVEEAANYYKVSPLLIETTLVNKGKVARERLRSRAF